MISSFLLALALAGGEQPLAVRVELEPLGRGPGGTVVGVGVQIAPEDRQRAGGRVRLEVTLLRGGKPVDTGESVVELQSDGSALIYREWPAGRADVRVVVEGVDGAARGGWTGPIDVPEMTTVFEAPPGAGADALAVAVSAPAEGVVKFLAPPRQGGIGALQLELAVPPQTAKVEFFQDDRLLVARQRPPWTVSVPLGEVARRSVVRGVAFANSGDYLGEDAVVLNAPAGDIPVELMLGPQPRGAQATRLVTVSVGGHAVDEVVLSLDDRQVARWTACPCVIALSAAEIEGAKVVAAQASGPGGRRGEAVKVQGVTGYQENVRVEVVELPVTVFDDRGHLVTDLTRDAFTVTEDGAEVAIEAFAATGELPLQVGVLVDVSGSMLKVFPAVRRAVGGFATDLLRPGDSAFLMTFAWDATVKVGWTGDPTAVASALEGITPEGGTSLHDAVVHGLEAFRGRRGRTALVVLSDGDDTTSRTGWETALRYVRTSRTPIFPLGFRLGLLDFFTRDRLKDLATATGGEAFFAPKSGELAAAYRRIGEQLRAQFLLTYRSPSSRGADHFRTVKVVVRRPGLTARTISGYFPAG